jgi:hypothetical protein
MAEHTEVLLPTGVVASEHIAGLRREKAEQSGAGGDPDRVKAADAEITKTERYVRDYKAGEADKVLVGPSLVEGVPVGSDGSAIPEVVSAAKPYNQPTDTAALETAGVRHDEDGGHWSQTHQNPPAEKDTDDTLATHADVKKADEHRPEHRATPAATREKAVRTTRTTR